jgi:polar amino acid transport system substrate-binding protein
MRGPVTTLRLACINSAATPPFERPGAGGRRLGYEPAVGALLADTLGWDLEWVYLPRAGMLPSLDDGRADAVLCGQSIVPTRQAVADFTGPYAVFHESVLVRAGDLVTSPEGLRGKRVAATAGSTSLALAETFDEAVTVPFSGESGDVSGEMLAALRAGDVDAVVDDDVAFVPLAGSADFDLAFTVKTGNRWGLAVSKARPSLLDALDEALAAVKADGRLAAAWDQWLPSLEYPFTAQ